MQQVKNLTTENGELSASNALLQVDVTSSVQNVDITYFKVFDCVDWVWIVFFFVIAGIC